MDIKELVGTNFRFKKSLGQNFISDTNLLRAVAVDAGVTDEDTIVEIGAGAGTLTSVLASHAKRVVSFEVDLDLQPVLKGLENRYPNLTVIFADVLKLSDEEIRKWVPERFKVVANLPYYVTTPMIMRFVDSTLDVDCMTLMMQREVALRLTAKPDTPEYGAITVAVSALSDVRITRTIDRRMFYPVPNVDSALLRLDFNRKKYDFCNYKIFKKVVKSAFSMRRKTLANNLIAAFSMQKSEAEEIIEKLGFPKTVRGEVLSCDDFVALAEEIAKK